MDCIVHQHGPHDHELPVSPIMSWELGCTVFEILTLHPFLFQAPAHKQPKRTDQELREVVYQQLQQWVCLWPVQLEQQGTTRVTLPVCLKSGPDKPEGSVCFLLWQEQECLQ